MAATRDERADAYLHGLLSPSEVREFERELERDAELRAAVDLARRRLALLESALPPAEANEQLVRATLERIDRSIWRRRTWRRRAYVALLAPLAAGLILIALFQLHYSTLAASPANLEVYGQHELLPGSEGALRVRLTDKRTQSPLAGVPVEVSLGEPGSEHFATLASFTTDQHGNGQPSFRLPDWADGTYPLRVTAQTAKQPEVVTQPVRLKRSAKLLLTSDKPVYQPGQTIHLRSLMLTRPSLKPAVDVDVTFTISDPKGNVVFRRVQRTSRFGIAAVDCPLAEELIEGAYRISCRSGDTDSALTVEIKKYVLPRLRVTLATEQAWYQPGQDVVVSIEANYFHGEPVADADWVVEASSPQFHQPLIAKLTGRTNADGKASVMFRLPQRLEGELSLAVEVTDRAGQKQSAAVRRAITQQPFRLTVVPENGTLVANVSNTVYVHVTTPDGSPVQVSGMVTVGGETHRLATGELGVAEFRVTPTDSAVMAIFDLADVQGRRQSQPLTLTVGMVNDYLLRLDRAVYRSGDSMHVTVLGGGSGPVFLDILKDDQTVRSEVIDLAQGRGELILDLPPELFGTLQLVTYRFGSDGRPVRKSRALYVRPTRQLQIGLKLPKPEFRPGERARLQFNLADEQGRPVAGALSLAAVDEAVFDVRQQLPGLERTFYLLEQKLLKGAATVYPWSPDTDLGGDAQQQTMLEQAVFARTTAADSPHTLVADTYPAKVQQVARERQQGLTIARLGWIALGLWVALAVYVLLWMNVRTLYMLILHGIAAVMLMCGVGIGLLGFVFASSQARLGDKSAMAPTAMANMMRDRGVPPPMAAPPGHAEALPSIRVRERFPETLLWQPQLITDEAGRAELDLEFADSITTWRLAAGAVSADGRLGALQQGLRVFQPFFVDLNLPVALTRGDEVEVSAVVSNFLPKAQTVELKLASGDWFELLGDANHKLELKAREVRSVSFRIRARKVGRFELQVTVTSGELGDAIKRPIEIVPEGRRIEQVNNGTVKEGTAIPLEVPENAIEGSAKAIVRLYPSSFSQLIEGLDGIFRLPTGCFEQTSSSLYPNVLALDYLRKTGRRVPEIEAKALQYIHVGAQRLLTFEVPGGGFDWYGRPPASITLTAYGLAEFRDLGRVHDIDPNLIARTRRWLMSQRAADGSWDDPQHRGCEDAALRRLRITAYVAAAVFDGTTTAEARSTRDFLLRYPPHSLQSAYDLALVCHALLAIHPQDDAVKPYLALLISMRQGDDPTRVWWPLGEGQSTIFNGRGRCGDIETTALAILALLRTDRFPPLVTAGLNWLIKQRQVGHWGSTQATILALKALLEGTGKPQPGPRRIDVELDDKHIATIEAAADQFDVMQQLDLSPHLKPGRQLLRLRDTAGNAPSYQVEFRYHVPGVAAAPAEGPLALDVTYDRETLTTAQVLQATATVTNRTDREAPMVMLDLPIPPGFRVDRELLEQLVRAGTMARFEVTPTQIIVYLRSLAAQRPLTFSYRLIPGNAAKLTIPPARVWEYYTPEHAARSRPATIQVRPTE